MNIGLTGSTGILGSILKKKLKLKKKNLFFSNIENYNNVKNWVKKNNFDYIIHLAAIVPTKTVNNNKNKALSVNYLGTKNLVNAINSYSKKKIWLFYSSTSHVYNFKKTKIIETDNKKPISFYGQTKLKGENYILKNQIMYKPCIGRIFSFTHTSQKKTFFVPSIFEKLAKAKLQKISFKNMHQKRDFISVWDIVRAISELYKQRKKGVYNICSNKGIYLHQIISLISKKISPKIKIIYKKDKSYNNLVGSNLKLSKTGWKHKDSLNKIINEFYKKK